VIGWGFQHPRRNERKRPRRSDFSGDLEGVDLVSQMVSEIQLSEKRAGA